MRWRPRERPASHDCEYCNKPVHTSSSCPGAFFPRSSGKVVMPVTGKCYCNYTCAAADGHPTDSCAVPVEPSSSTTPAHATTPVSERESTRPARAKKRKGSCGGFCVP
eukprot:209566-Pleurochrysis_carterae.AAC.1